jgi:basic membrane protein A and related proteins
MRRAIWTTTSIMLVGIFLLTACAAPAPAPAAAPQAPAAAQPAAEPTAAPQPTAVPAAQEAAAEPWKVCFVYNSAVGDAGWVYAADQGRKYVEQKLGVETAYIENIPAGADAERAFAQLAEQGCNQIISTTNTHADAVDRVAPKYPNVIFEAYDGFDPQPNLRVYRLALYEAYYLIGVLAGKMAETGQAGWVAGFAAPSYPSQANSMLIGARSVNPDFQLKLVFMNKWSDPPNEKQAAESLAAAGAELLTNSMSSPTVIQTAESKGLFSVGRTEQCSYGPKYCIGSMVVGWGAIFEHQIKTAMDGTWDNSETYWATLSNDGVGVAEIGPAVPDDVKALLEKTKADIKSGELVFWKGPIKDQAGVERIAEGQVLTAEELSLMDWFIEGMQSSAQ